jgi:phospholipid/cholesterol/gamma-HCH transport system substrate-binding protein
MGIWSRRGLAALTGGVLVASASGCGLLSGGAYDVPLPGGADLGSHPVSLSADFSDVLDLVPQSSVRVDNVAVGRVTRITLNPDGRSAHVELKVNGDVQLPAGTTVRLQNTSLLGEKYVALLRPQEPVAGPDLASGDRLGQEQTSHAAEVEQVLGALSMVLNGGNIGQFQEISRELQKISAGRTEQVRSSLQELDTFVTTLNQRRGAITAALDGLAGLATTLDRDRDKIATALDGLSPGLQVLADQRSQLVAMLRALDRLSQVTVSTLNASQQDIVADLRALAPILDRLAASGSDLPNALEILLTYPFPDSVLGAVKGDYLNIFVTTNFRTPSNCAAAGCSWPQAVSARGTADRSHGTGTGGVPNLLPPTSSPMPGLPTPTITVPAPSPSPSGLPSQSGVPSPSGIPSQSGPIAPGTTPGTTPSPAQTAGPTPPQPGDPGPSSPEPTGTTPAGRSE